MNRRKSLWYREGQKGIETAVKESEKRGRPWTPSLIINEILEAHYGIGYVLKRRPDNTGGSNGKPLV